MAADDLAPAVGAAGATHDDADLARELARCQHCLGACLVAAETRRNAQCPVCGQLWLPPRLLRETVVDVPGDLAAVARWYPAIMGRAWAPSEMGRGPGRHGERPEYVDAHHRDRRSGLRTALAALSHLDALERAGQSRHVRVLWYAYVLCGPEFVRKTPGGLDDLVSERFSSEELKKVWREQKSANVRRLQQRTYGARLLTGARAAYESAVRGTLRAAAPATGMLSADLDRLLARSLAKVANDHPPIANDCPPIASAGANRQR